ncbi:MAG: endonuclease/exonuclease/phosphatase family protein [Microthrixaceae bacterium]
MRALTMCAVGLVALVAACAPVPSDPGSPPTTIEPLPGPGEFSVLSYNVAGLPQEFSQEQPSVHIPLISPLLNDYDVVATQEDFDWWQPIVSGFDFVNYHTRLRAQATHPYRTDRHPGPEAVGVNASARGLFVGDGIGIMARFPLLDVGHHAWSGCFGGVIPDGGAADCLAMKGFRVATMVLGDGAEVDVYSLHAEAGGTAADQALQVDDYQELAAVIATRSVGRAVIVAGDTNLHTDLVHPDGTGGADIEIWDGFLAATGLTDTCVELSCPETGAIDKIAYRSSATVELDAVSHDFPVERFRTPAGEDLSDHPPLVVRFAWDHAA